MATLFEQVQGLVSAASNPVKAGAAGGALAGALSAEIQSLQGRAATVGTQFRALLGPLTENSIFQAFAKPVLAKPDAPQGPSGVPGSIAGVRTGYWIIGGLILIIAFIFMRRK